ncbi:unnamed protein product [Toxocara canis]|uniref:Uncharacterized protein n=1 Tax=Toxocara canis TaxID=6265 RepID=A0A183VAT3_TOXCA|nr:unnamed protein product [Toxocara canis]
MKLRNHLVLRNPHSSPATAHIYYYRPWRYAQRVLDCPPQSMTRFPAKLFYIRDLISLAGNLSSKSANKTNWKIEGRSVQPTRLYRKRILTPAENTILIVAIGVTFIVALCLVCIVALQCCCAKAQTFGEDGESDSKSSLSPISSPIILEMLKLELERQKRKRRDESVESDEDDSRV